MLFHKSRISQQKWTTPIPSTISSFKYVFSVYWVTKFYKCHSFPKVFWHIEENQNEWYKLQFHIIPICDLGQTTYWHHASVSSFVMWRLKTAPISLGLFWKLSVIKHMKCLEQWLVHKHMLTCITCTLKFC